MIQARCDGCSHVHGALKIVANRTVAPPSLFGNHLIRGLFVCRLKARRKHLLHHPRIGRRQNGHFSGAFSKIHLK